MNPMMTKSAARNDGSRARRSILRGAAVAVLGLILYAWPSAPLRATETAEPGAFLSWLTTQAIEELTDDSVALQDRRARFRGLFRDHFDIPTIGRFVLGRYWRRADDNARQDFLAAFEDIMVERFAPEFAGYKGTGFHVGAVRQVTDSDQVIVSTTVTPPGSETLQVDWRVRRRDGRFQILDVIGQGVSMALTLRSEYGAFLKNSGGRVESLTAMLRERLDHDASLATKAAN